MNRNYDIIIDGELYHHGILGQKWGIRRYQNEDGSLTAEGLKRYKYDKVKSDIGTSVGLATVSGLQSYKLAKSATKLGTHPMLSGTLLADGVTKMMSQGKTASDISRYAARLADASNVYSLYKGASSALAGVAVGNMAAAGILAAGLGAMAIGDLIKAKKQKNTDKVG